MSFVRNVILLRRITAVIAVVGVLGGFSYNEAFAQSAAKLEIRTLSSRPEFVSGGDALIEVKAPGFNTMYPVHSEPRLVAGAPLTNDVLKCQLKPVNYADYKTTFTVAQKARMAAIFPAGVCDFSKPGVEQVPLKGTYRRY